MVSYGGGHRHKLQRWRPGQRREANREFGYVGLDEQYLHSSPNRYGDIIRQAAADYHPRRRIIDSSFSPSSSPTSSRRRSTIWSRRRAARSNSRF